MNLLGVVNKHILEKECSPKEAQFLTSKSRLFTISYFYIIWKILKTRAAIVAGYDWILTPAFIFAGHFLNEFTATVIFSLRSG